MGEDAEDTGGIRLCDFLVFDGKRGDVRELYCGSTAWLK